MKLFVDNKASLIESPLVLRRSLGRYRTCDTAITFRMVTGFPGDVNRGHPASIEPCLISPVNPVTSYGQAVLVDTAANSNNGVRPVVDADRVAGVTEIWGVTARPYPIQQSTTANNYGAVGYGTITPPPLQPVDVMRGGYIMVPVVGAPVKGGIVYIWTAASGGGHTQGGFEAVNPAGNGIVLNSAFQWNSPADSSGIAELICSKY